jgi:hypothetical protein
MASATSSRSLRKIPVVLLGEMHNDHECSIKNIQKMSDILQLGTPAMMARSDFLLVSEGRGVNACYTSLGLPKDRILIEHSSGQTKLEIIDKLILQVELLSAVAIGQLKRGTGSEAGRGIPDMVTIDEDFFIMRARYDGYWSLLQTIPNGIELHEKMITEAFFKNEEAFYLIYIQFIQYLAESNYLDNEQMSSEIKDNLRQFARTRDGRYLKTTLAMLRMSRDASIIKRIEDTARRENATLKLIVVIFGALHYDNLGNLIRGSNALSLDSRSEINIDLGGKKRKRYRKSKNNKHKRRKTTKNKKYTM